MPLANGQVVDIYTWATKEGNSRIVGLLALDAGDGEVSGLPEVPNNDDDDEAVPYPEDAEAADGAPNTVIGDSALLKDKDDSSEREGGDGEEEPIGVEEEGQPDNRSTVDGDVQTAEVRPLVSQCVK